jgi:hypothetical protein
MGAARGRPAPVACALCSGAGGGGEEEGLLGQVSRKARWAGWPLGRLGQKLREKSFQNKNWIFEYTKALENCRRRFRRNLDMGIFPKFF